MCFKHAAGDMVTLHLKSLPPSTSSDIITYFEAQGGNVEVLSVDILQDDRAMVSLSGLSKEGTYMSYLEQENIVRVNKKCATTTVSLVWS